MGLIILIFCLSIAQSILVVNGNRYLHLDAKLRDHLAPEAPSEKYSDSYNSEKLQNLHKYFTPKFLAENIELLDAVSEAVLNSAPYGSCLDDSIYLLNALRTYLSTSRNTCNNGNNSTCLQLQKKAANDNLWALKVLDAYAKPPAGFLVGNTFWLGDYQECVGIKSYSTADPTTKFVGKYCSVFYPLGLTIKGTVAVKQYDCSANTSAKPTAVPAGNTEGRKLKEAFGLKIGICIPNSCNGNIVKSLLSDIYHRLNPNTTVNLALPITCHEPLEMKHDATAISMIVVCGIFAVVMAMGTIFDVYEYNPMSKKYPIKAPKVDDTNYAKYVMTRQQHYDSLGAASKFLLAFSIYSNGKKLLSVEKRPGQLECIHGIRFISMTWVILGHTYYFAQNWIDNLAEFANILNELPSQALLNATVSVDTFFILSGCLLTYLWLKQTDKEKGKNITTWYHWVLFYVHRYIRAKENEKLP